MLEFYLFLFALGSILGSFLNVLIIRFNTAKSLLGRSSCMRCKKKLFWYELVPILSFIFLKGKCSKCLTKISPQYPVVEILSGLTFVFAFYVSNNFFEFVLLILFFEVLLVASVYDFYHMIVPYSFSFILFVLAFMYQAASFDLKNILLSLVGGVASSFLFALLYILSKGRWIGFADVLIAFSLGVFFGGWRGFFIVIFSVFLGALFGSFYVLNSYVKNRFVLGLKEYKINSEIPFVPFIYASAVFEAIFELSKFYYGIVF